MADFVSRVVVGFRDQFSAGVGRARQSFAGMRGALDEIGANNSMLAVSSQLAMAASMTEPFRRSLTESLEKPKVAAGGLESSMAAVNSVITEGNAIGGDLAATYEEIERASLAWASGAAKGSKLASMGAKEFASASYSMLSAGLKGEAAILGTGRSAILAKATMGQAADAGNLLARLYNNMGDAAVKASGDTMAIEAEMTRLGDIVASTQATFQLSNLSQLSEGLKYGVPAAQQYGVSLSQLSAVVGQLNTAGLEGSMAGTSFGSMMAQMIKASGDLDFSLKYDDSGGMDVIATMEGIVAQFGPIDKLSNDMKSDFQKAFGQEGLRAVTLLGKNIGDLRKNYETVADSGGTMEEMAAKMSDTYEDAQARYANLTEALSVKTGKAANEMSGAWLSVKTKFLSGVVAPVMNSPLGDKLAFLSAGAKTLGATFLDVAGTGMQTASQLALLSSAAANAGGYAKLFKESISLVTMPLKGAFSAGKKLVTGIFGMAKSFIMAIPKAFAFAAANWAAVGPILAVVAGAALLAAGVYLLIKHWDKVSAFFVKVWSGIKSAFSAGWNWIRNFLSSDTVLAAVSVFMPFVGLPALVIKHWGKISAFFSQVWEGIKSAFFTGWNWIKDFFSSDTILAVVSVFMPFIGIPALVIKHWESIKTFFSGFWDSITGMAAAAGEKLLAPFLKVKDFLGGAWDKIFGGGKKNTDSPSSLDVAAEFAAHIKAGKSADAVISTMVPDGGKKNTDSPSSLDVAAEFAARIKAGESADAVISTMASGVRQDDSLYKAVSDSLGRTARLFPHSDAKEGPFSSLTASGRAIGSTMAAGLSKDKSLDTAAGKQFAEVLSFPRSSQAETQGKRTPIKENLAALLAKFAGQRKEESPGSGNIHIEHLQMDADEIEDMLGFYRKLKEEIGA